MPDLCILSSIYDARSHFQFLGQNLGAFLIARHVWHMNCGRDETNKLIKRFRRSRAKGKSFRMLSQLWHRLELASLLLPYPDPHLLLLITEICMPLSDFHFRQAQRAPRFTRPSTSFICKFIIY